MERPDRLHDRMGGQRRQRGIANEHLKETTTRNITMRTMLFALALAAAMPAGAQEPMTYARLCGATEGTGDNNDFCALWARNNWQGMRNALSISIRTARAAENRNRFYFDHKRGAQRGAFIQLKRPWMGDDWQVRHTYNDSEGDTRTYVVSIYSPTVCGADADGDGLIECVQVVLKDADFGYGVFGVSSVAAVQGYDAGFYSVSVRSGDLPGVSEEAETVRVGGLPSDYVRSFVECNIDLIGWHMGEVEVRPTCDQISR